MPTISLVLQYQCVPPSWTTMSSTRWRHVSCRLLASAAMTSSLQNCSISLAKHESLLLMGPLSTSCSSIKAFIVLVNLLAILTGTATCKVVVAMSRRCLCTGGEIGRKCCRILVRVLGGWAAQLRRADPVVTFNPIRQPTPRVDHDHVLRTPPHPALRTGWIMIARLGFTSTLETILFSQLAIPVGSSGRTSCKAS